MVFGQALEGYGVIYLRSATAGALVWTAMMFGASPHASAYDEWINGSKPVFESDIRF